MNWDLKKRGKKNLYSIRVYIPPELQHMHLTSAGNPKSEIVRALGTGDRQEARRKAVSMLPELTREVFSLPNPQGYVLKAPLVQHETVEKDGRQETVQTYDSTHPLAYDIAEEIAETHGIETARAWHREASGVLTLESVADQFEAYLRIQGKLKERTIKKSRQAISEFADWWWDPSAELTSIRVQDADDFVAHLKDSGAAPQTINSKISALSSLWKWGKRRGHATDNIWAGLSVRNESTRDPRPFSPEEIKDIHKHLHSKPDTVHQDLFQVLVFTGLRIDEVCSLTVERITFNDLGCITGFHALHGKPGEKSKHWIPVIEKGSLAIIARRIEGKTAKDRLFDELVAGEQGYSHNVAKTLRYRYRKALGMPLDGPCEVDNHSLRRVHATAAENAGLMPEEIDRLQRRKSGYLALDTYSAGPHAERKSEMQAKVTEEILKTYWQK
ncbi:site-specific integrase [Oceanicaulis sp.]|uniref:site-specific integrase n=1 Tax=Oceanicaulis sp. TaxID=1924941 RepID=UPI003D2CD56E